MASAPSLRALLVIAAGLAGAACQSNASETVAATATPAPAEAKPAPVPAPAVTDAVPAAAPAAPAAPGAPGGATASPATPAPAAKPGMHVLVLRDGRRIDCLEPPVFGMGRVLYKSPDGVTHAIKEDLVDAEATKLAPAPAAGKPAQVSLAKPAAAPEPRAPLDFEATRTDGSKVRLSDLKGKVVLVDFWATWCGPCMREMPHVKAAYSKLAGPNFEILGVSLDRDRERFDAYLRDEGIAWPQYYDGKQWQNEVARAWGVSSIPTAVLIGKDGKVAKVGLRGGELEFAVAELISQ